jgi:hypothetical protein
MSELDKWNAGGIGNFDASNYPITPENLNGFQPGKAIADGFVQGAIIGGILAYSRSRRIYRENADRWIAEGKDPEQETYKQLNHEANINLLLGFAFIGGIVLFIFGSAKHWW